MDILPLRKEESEPESKIDRNEAYSVFQTYFQELKEINQVSDRHTDIPRLMRVLDEYEKKKL